MSRRRILLLTAGYGEGHNSAARALKEQGEARGYECFIHDLCHEAMPRAFRATKAAYLHIIGHWPWVWRALFDLADNMDTGGRTPALLADIRQRLLELMEALQPDAVVCTFPIYALMLDEARERMGRALPPHAVVITDSLAVSRSWVCSHPDLWLVTDESTRARLLDTYGLDPARMEVSGFPVSNRFAPSLSSWSEGEPFRVLYVPQAAPAIVAWEMKAMLAAHPDVHLTVVTGKKRALFERLSGPCGVPATEAARRVTVLGWVDTMPELMAAHHLYVGKAGGASMHECYAACLPALVNFFVPGQEEGNLELLLAEGCGRVAENPVELGGTLAGMLHGGAEGWSAMKTAMREVARRGGAERCWEFFEKNWDL